MSEPMWDNPTEPRTEAGRRLIASYPGNAAEAASPAFIRHMAQSILAIEQEAARRDTPAPALREALANARYSNDQTHGAHNHDRSESCGGEYVVGNCIIRSALAASAPVAEERLDPLGQDILDSFLTSVAYLMEDHGTSVIDIVDLNAVARDERVAFAERLGTAARRLTPGASESGSEGDR